MCGIAGYFTQKIHDKNIVNVVSKMNALQHHRGPDDEGVVGFSHLDVFPQNVTSESRLPFLSFKKEEGGIFGAIGHKRLSILDLSELGHCPMSDENGRYWITHNGEIYNYIEIKEELIGLGVKFFSNTDTEVVLKSFIHWGPSCINKFNGMWSFVIYDRQEMRLFGSRDRAGVKPMYYYIDKYDFQFASEQKAIVKAGIYKTEINKRAAFDYLAFTSLELEKEGLFKNIIELEPGYNFEFDLKTWDFKTNQYYNIQEIENIEIDEKEAINKIESLLENSIKLRMRSDVPIGACLSGGIDSSTIVGFLSKLGASNLETFTSVSDYKEFDESNWAQIASNYNSTLWHTVNPNAEGLLNDIETLSYSQDIPLFSTSTYAQYKVMELVKANNIKVVLDGQGGDELFAGYTPYYVNFWLDILKKKGPLKMISEMTSVDTLSKSSKFLLKQYFRFYGLNKMPSGIKNKVFKSVYPDINFISKDLFEYKTSSFSITKDNYPKSLNDVLKYEFYNTRLKQYLKCEDRCSMWHSVEARVPFADDINLINFVFSIPGEMKIKSGISKYLLRESSKHVLPKEIYKRKDKMGYLTPNNKWISDLRNDLKKYFIPELNEFIDVKALLNNYDNFFDQTNKIENQRIYKFIAFAVWYKMYFTE